MVTSTNLSPAEHRAAQRAARADAMQKWERQREMGRSAFIWRNGVVGWGLPAAALTALYKVVQEQGLAWPPEITPALQVALALIAVACPCFGYMLGSWLWTSGEAGYQRMHHERELDSAMRDGSRP